MNAIPVFVEQVYEGQQLTTRHCQCPPVPVPIVVGQRLALENMLGVENFVSDSSYMNQVEYFERFNWLVMGVTLDYNEIDGYTYRVVVTGNPKRIGNPLTR